MNCHNLHPRCKAECCACTTPIPKEIWERNQQHMQRAFTEKLEDEDHVWLVTDDARCVFLKENLDCAIHHDKPWICKKFGDESCSMMTCSWQAADGRERSRQERRKIERQHDKDTETYTNAMRKLKVIYE